MYITILLHISLQVNLTLEKKDTTLKEVQNNKFEIFFL